MGGLSVNTAAADNRGRKGRKTAQEETVGAESLRVFLFYLKMQLLSVEEDPVQQ